MTRRDWRIILPWLDAYIRLYKVNGLDDYTMSLIHLCLELLHHRLSWVSYSPSLDCIFECKIDSSTYLA
ncbi:hypothetical protein HanPSC8_Chr10g0436531 [Helianthus annuus]|nr:hypothetical protein HanPSC8_Chr10g0436531 [Helianthus annuus]